jgi:N-acetylneuraminic acid mutarotase
MKTKLRYLILPLLLIAIVFTSKSSYGQWVRKSNSIKPRSDLSESIVYNSKLYTFMGFMDHQYHTEPSSEVYDPATDTWTALAPIPDNASRTHQRAVLIDNTVWQICGRVGTNPGPLTSDIWIYNITTDSWSKGPELRDPETGQPLLWAAGGAALLGRTLHLFGGFVINACNNDQSKYHLTLDVDKWLADPSKPAKWMNYLAPLPIKRNHLSTVVLGGKIYAIGGQFGHDCGGGKEQRYSHVYDPATDTWTELPLLPDGRSHAEGASFAIDGKIYIVGGQNGKGRSTNAVTIFDPAGNNGAGSWTDDPSLALPYNYEGGSSKVIGNTFIYAEGGEEASARPKARTFTRTIARNPVYKLGFSSGCLNLTANSGSSVKGRTLLFTIDGEKNYTTSTNASWLTVTKNATGTTTPNAVDIVVKANTAGLAPGNYSALVTARGSAEEPYYTEATYCVNLTVNGTIASADTLEAETATLNGVKVASNHPDFSGTGFGDYQNPYDDYIEWSFNKAEAGATTLEIGYSNGREANRPMRLEVNGEFLSNVSFPSTGSWTNWSSAEAVVNLNAGINKVRLTAIGASGPNVDYLAYSSNSSFAQKGAAQNIIGNSTNLLNVSVTPNPASGNARLVLTSSSRLPVEMELSDMLGKTYQKMKFLNDAANTYNFSVANLPPGIYIIKVKQGATLQTTKLLVGNKSSRQ